MKKILFILDTFHPEYASTGQLMTELCQHLQYDFEITVIVGVPKYGIEEDEKYAKKTFHFEEFENIKVIRVKTPKVNKQSKISRILFILGHFINAFRATFRVDRPDIIYVISQPPILGGYLGRLTKLFRGGKLVYNIQDFNPEQVEAVGYNRLTFINHIARRFDNTTIQKADRVIVVGRDMYETLRRRHKKNDMSKAVIINNWINEDAVHICNRSCNHMKVDGYCDKYESAHRFTVMYSGNIGLYYDLENIIQVIKKFKDHDDMHFVFVGDGAYREHIQEYCIKQNMKNVEFHDYVPKHEIQCSLSAADVHLVTNQKGIKGVSVPSKIYGVLATGKPVLGILEKDSEAELIIRDANCGRSVEPQDYEGIERLIEWFYEHQDEARILGLNGRSYLEQNLRMQTSLERYKTELKKLVTE